MKIAAFSIADYCEATEGMPHDVERLYFRMLMKMYSREGGLPDSDNDNARMFGYRDVRTYKTLKAKLLKWPDAILVKDGELRNARVDSDLVEVEIRKRSAADRGRIGGSSKKDRPEIKRGSQEDRPSIPHTTNNENNDLAEASPSPSPSPTPSPSESASTVEQDPAADARPDDPHELFKKLTQAANGSLSTVAIGLECVGEPIAWIRGGADLELDVLPMVRALGHRAEPRSINSWRYFASAVAQAKARRERGLPQVHIPDSPDAMKNLRSILGKPQEASHG
jgi:uncharacterized protein YdaU (DUF1376 family)